MNSLPELFVARGLELANGMLLFGKLFCDMTRDELIAAAAQGWNAEHIAREEVYATATARAALFVEQAKRAA